MDVSTTPIDFLTADGHKWLLGAEGAAIFYARREVVERLHPVGVGWNSVIASGSFAANEYRLKPHAGRWESGSLNVAGISALGASVELLRSVGIPAVAERVLELAEYLCERAVRAGFQVFSSRRPGEQSGIVSLTGFATPPRSLVHACRLKKVIVNHRAGRIRVSPHCYNSTDEIDRVVDTLCRADRKT